MLNVLGVEAFHQLHGCLPGECQLWPVHGTGSVEHDRDVEGHVSGDDGSVRFDVQQYVDSMAVRITFVVDQDGRIHWVPWFRDHNRGGPAVAERGDARAG